MAVPVQVPRWGEIMEDCTVLAWLRTPGAAVSKDEPLLEIETEKMTGEIKAPATGFLGPHLVAAGQRVEVGGILTVILAAGEKWQPEPAPEAGAAAASTAGTPAVSPPPAALGFLAGGRTGGRISPAALDLAKRFAIDPATINAPGRRIKRADVLAAVAERLGSSYSTFRQLDDQEVHGLRHGRGRPLLLLHGLGGAAVTWEANLGSLAAGCDVYAPDLPAHGLTLANRHSTLNALADFAAALVSHTWPDTSVSVLGHSLGGAVAVRLARRHPQLIERLLLVAPAGLSPTVPEGFARLLWAEPTPETSRALFKFLYSTPVPIPSRLVSLLQAYRILPGRTMAYAELLADCVRPDGAQVLDISDPRPLGSPTLVVWGEADQVAPIRAGRQWADAVSARWAEFPGAGHCPHVEAAPEFHRLAADFLC